MTVSWMTAAMIGVLGAGCVEQATGDRRQATGDRRLGFVVVGETTKVKRGEELPRSMWFDGEVVRLRAVRGEVVGVQVLAERATEMRLEMEGVEVEGFEIGFVEVTEPSSALYGKSTGSGWYPDVLRPVEGAVTGEGAFFDVRVARSVAAGVHGGRLRVGDEVVPVELAVDDVVIDVERAPLVWVWFKGEELARAHRGENAIEVERRYREIFRRHGVLLASDWSLDELRLREDAVTSDVKFWPVGIDKRDPARMAEEVRGWIDYFHGRPQIPFAFTIDEPGEEERAQVATHGRAIRAAGGGDPRFLYAVTDEPRPIYRGAVDVFVSPVANPPPAGYGNGIHFWTYNGRAPAAGNMTIDKAGTALRSWGWIAARYSVDLWYGWEGLYYTDRYNGASAPTDLERQPVSYDERRRGGEDHGNGDGVLVYPGPVPSLRLKALRRGLIDRLLLARLSACGAGGAADAAELAHRMVPRALGEARGAQRWPDDEETWERARQVLLDALVARCQEEA